MTIYSKKSFSKSRLGEGNPNYKHGLCKHPFYKTWDGMITRCYNARSIGYENYGGRGITVCEEWKSSPENFINWIERYIEQNGEIPSGYTLDRKDTNNSYCPENCCFSSKKQQNLGRRCTWTVEHEGKNISFMEFVEKHGIVSYLTAKKRVQKIWIYYEGSSINSIEI